MTYWILTINFYLNNFALKNLNKRLNLFITLTSVSSLIRTPVALRNACINASVLLTSTEKISLAEIQTNGVSSPIAFETAENKAIGK